MKQFRIFCSLLLTIIAIYQSQAQSGWSRGKGNIYAQTSFSYFSSDKYHDINGELAPSTTPEYNAYSFLFYGEYGIGKQLTAILNTPIYKFNNLSTTETVGGLGDVRLGLKLQPMANFPLSLSVEAEIPTGNGENLAAYKDEAVVAAPINLTTTDGEFNIWSTIAISGATSDGNHFGSFYISHNSRNKGLSNQMRVGGEYGFLVDKKLWVIGKLQTQTSLSDTPQNSTFLFGEGTEYTSLELALFYKVTDKWRLTASYLNYTDLFVSQKNLYDGGSIALGVAFELNK